jgi:Caspase domain
MGVFKCKSNDSKKYETTYPRLSLPKVDLQLEYDMNHKKRGVALILNHEFYDRKLGFSQRLGTDIDLEKLIKTLETFDFDVFHYTDLTKSQISSELDNCECFLLS